MGWLFKWGVSRKRLIEDRVKPQEVNREDGTTIKTACLAHCYRGNAYKGVLLSPPGCGKSQFAKALGTETDRPTILLDLGALMGSLVGETERNVRKALAQIDAMAPCVCVIDEVEKALSGLGSSGDSGVSSRMFGTILSWLNDRTSDSFVVCTCNDISKLPPEFGRSERFDGVFFIDLPSQEQRYRIWAIHMERYGLTSTEFDPPDKPWSGAEIQSCCRLAAIMGVSLKEAAKYVVPISATAGEQVEALRQWASHRCLDADNGGLYVHELPQRGRVAMHTHN